MAEYVDREALLKSKQWLALQDRDKAMAKSIIQRQPTADVVEVVRCKDCVHAGYPEDKIVWCLKHKKYMPKYGYCNYGKEQDDG